MPQESQAETTHGVRKILVATDFSAASARARDYAIALAAPRASLTLLHAHFLPLPDWPEPTYVPDWISAEPSVREEALERLRLFGAPARAAGLLVKTVLQEGLPTDVILAQAATLHPDLIAMGSKGRRGFERWAMGSTAERVLRLAPAPVLTVSAQASGSLARIREVLCPLGLESGSETLAVAREVAVRCGSVLTLMHVLESALGQAPGDRAERWARQRLSEAVAAAGDRVHAEAVIRAGHPSREILQVARERAVDVIVMGAHHRLSKDRDCFGSTAGEVVREAGCAVIAVPSAVEKGSRVALEARMASV